MKFDLADILAYRRSPDDPTGAPPAPPTPPTPPAPPTPPTPPTPAPSPAPLPDDVLEQLKRAAASNGGFQHFSEVLYDDNKKLRDERRALQGKVPADGSVVLSGEDAAAWNALQEAAKALNLPAGKSLEALTAAGKEAAALKREKLLLRAAQSASNPNVLDWNLQVLSDITAGVELAVEGSGAKEKVVVKLPDGKSKGVREWVESEKAAYLPALRVSTGTPAVPQGGGSPKPAPSSISEVIKSFQEQRDAAPNPLLKK